MYVEYIWKSIRGGSSKKGIRSSYTYQLCSFPGLFPFPLTFFLSANIRSKQCNVGMMLLPRRGLWDA